MSVSELVSDFMHEEIYGSLRLYFTDDELNRIAIRSGIHDGKEYTKRACDLGLTVRYGDRFYLRAQAMVDFFRKHGNLKYPEHRDPKQIAETFIGPYGSGGRNHSHKVW